MLKDSLFGRLLKKVQMQGGPRRAERGVLQVRRSEWSSVPTQQMGPFQQPADDVLDSLCSEDYGLTDPA
jgi:hypothetical protein